MIRVESPIPVHEVPLAWFWLEQIRGRVFSDYGPTSVQEFLDREWGPSLCSWSILDSDSEMQACGFIRGTEDPGVVRLYLYWRKSAVVVDALRAIVERVFAGGYGNRVEMRAWADAMNVFNLCRKAGGTREAFLRKSSMRGGNLADQALYVWLKE